MTAWVIAALFLLSLVIIIIRKIRKTEQVVYCKYCNNPLRRGRNAYICDLCEAGWSCVDEDDDLN